MHGRDAVMAGRCHPLRCVCWGLARWPTECRERRQLGNVVCHGPKDDRGRLCAMDAEAGLTAQIEHLQSNRNVPLDDGTVWGYEVGMTGDGKGMEVANYSPHGKCWSCDDHDSLEPVGGVNEQVRWGAFLRALLPPRRVGDYAHATARLCNAT